MLHDGGRDREPLAQVVQLLLCRAGQRASAPTRGGRLAAHLKVGGVEQPNRIRGEERGQQQAVPIGSIKGGPEAFRPSGQRDLRDEDPQRGDEAEEGPKEGELRGDRRALRRLGGVEHVHWPARAEDIGEGKQRRHVPE